MVLDMVVPCCGLRNGLAEVVGCEAFVECVAMVDGFTQVRGRRVRHRHHGGVCGLGGYCDARRRHAGA